MFYGYKHCIINVLNNTKIKQISCGTDHTLILNNIGNIYVCGNNNNGQLCLLLSNTKLYNFILNKNIIDKNIIQIECGHLFTLILDINGNVYGFGNNEYGQIGLGKLNKKYKNFELCKTKIDENIKYIQCGYNFSCILDIYGNVYAFGKNDKGQIGNNGIERCYYEPWKLVYPKNVKVMKCGRFYCILVDGSGVVYGFGSNDVYLNNSENIVISNYGCWTVDLIKNVKRPQIVNFGSFKVPRIDQVICGKYHPIFVSFW